MRKEVIGNATLYLGDCREILPEITREVIASLITDPVWPNVPNGLLAGSDRPYLLFCEMWAAMRVLPKRSVIVMRSDSDPRFLRGVPVEYPFFRTCELPYVMPGYIGRKLGGDELAYCFGEPIPSRPGQKVIPGRGPSVQPDGRAANGHPCSRALGHFEWLIRWWSEADETVIDPFMGSGTTCVAAQIGGRKSIGIEIEQSYFDIACRRMDDAMRQERLLA